MDRTDTQYNGWKNWETWNVALWLSNDHPLYFAVKGYKGYVTPYLSLRRDLRESFSFTKTKDGVSLWNPTLDISALNALIEKG